MKLIRREAVCRVAGSAGTRVYLCVGAEAVAEGAITGQRVSQGGRDGEGKGVEEATA